MSKQARAPRFDYFSGAGHGWTRFAAIRADDLYDERGSKGEEYILKRLRAAPLFSFERRRWRLIRKFFVAERARRHATRNATS